MADMNDQQALVVDDDLIERLMRGEKPQAKPHTSAVVASLAVASPAVASPAVASPAVATPAINTGPEEKASSPAVVPVADAEITPPSKPETAPIHDAPAQDVTTQVLPERPVQLPQQEAPAAEAAVVKPAAVKPTEIEPVAHAVAAEDSTNHITESARTEPTGTEPPRNEPTPDDQLLALPLPSRDQPTPLAQVELASVATPPVQPVKPRPTFAGAFAKAVSLASQGHLADAIEALELGAEMGEDPVEIHSGLGHLRFEQQNWAEAAHHYAAVAQAEPGHPTAHYNLALCLERQEKFAEAAEAFGQALTDDPARWQAELGRGLCLLRVPSPQEALACLDRVEENARNSGLGNPQRARVYDALRFGRAAALQQTGKLDQAWDIYQSLLPTYTDSVDLLANLVTLAASRKEWSTVEELSGSLVDLEPTSHAALRGLAAAALERGDSHSAVLYSEETVRQYPKAAEGWFNLALAYDEAGQFREAGEAYEEALRLEPSLAEASANLSVILQRDGDLAGAEKACRRALTSRPGLLGVIWNLALLNEAAGRPEEAERYYGKVMIARPENPGDGPDDRPSAWQEAGYRLGMLQLERSQYARAAASFRSFLQTLPQQHRLQQDARFHLGLALWKAGDADGAAAQFDQVLESQPGDAASLQYLTAIRAEQQDHRAFDLFEKARALGPVPAQLAFNIGLLHDTAGDPESALQSYRAALAQQPDLAEALLNQGLILDEEGDHAQAHQLWSAALWAKPELVGA